MNEGGVNEGGVNEGGVNEGRAPHQSSVDGVAFIEGPAPFTRSFGRVTMAIGLQNADLFAIKQALARKVRAKGGNAVINFTYGQRPHHGLQLLNPFRWDTESWFGAGEAVTVDPAR